MGKRVFLCTIAIVFILQAILLLFTHLGIKVIESSTEQKTKKVHLLILSTWRSGSSLVGQLFSQHPDVFYLKEPAWHVWRSMFQNGARVLHMAVRDLLRLVFRCDMSVFDAYMQNKSCVSDLFNWASSRALCSPPACKSFSRNDIVTETACKKKCGHYPFKKVEDTCNTYSHVVVQEVRIFDLKVLYSLLRDPTLNLKILHVVRDPRALAKSREKVKFSLAFDNGIVLNTNGAKVFDSDFKVLQEICQSQADIYRTTNSQQPSFLKDRYMLLRYDDLVREPLRKVREIYSFANLKLTEKMMTWIYTMTHGKQQQTVNSFQITPRDALNVSQAWRKVLSINQTSKVQNVCKDAMDIFSYQFIDSVEELRDLTMDSVLPRQRDDFVWLSKKENE